MAHSENEIPKSGKGIRPNVSHNLAVKLVSDIWGFEVKGIKELDSYDDRNFHVMVSQNHKNVHVEQVWPHGFVLKVLNRFNSLNVDHIDAENEMMYHLSQNGFGCQIPVKTLKGEAQVLYESVDEELNDDKHCKSRYLLRLLTFIPGQVLSSVPLTTDLLYMYGKYVGQISNCLTTFSHHAICNVDNYSMWVLASVPKLRNYLFAVKDEKQRFLVQSILATFDEEVVTRMGSFRQGSLHGDMHDLNVLIVEDAGSSTGYKISGVLDFADAQYSCLFFEIAVGLMDIMNECKIIDILDIGGHVLAGYLSECKLTAEEMDAMKVCVAARFCQAMVMGAYNITQDPSNVYVTLTAREGWGQLKTFWDTPKQMLYSKWDEIIKSYS